MNDKVNIYALGLLCCSVCAPNDLTPEEVEAAVNAQSPTGISVRWHISDDETFKGGKPNPCACDKDPDTRMHYLLDC